MLYVISYDIATPKRLRKLAKCCELYGGRIEKSVFEMNLDETRFQRFWDEANSILDPTQDALVAYKVCAACEKDIRLGGTATRPPAPPNCIFVG
jgi:CRISPR-associated protein Cas2